MPAHLNSWLWVALFCKRKLRSILQLLIYLHLNVEHIVNMRIFMERAIFYGNQCWRENIFVFVVGVFVWDRDSSMSFWICLRVIKRFTLLGHLFTYMDFLECPCCLGCNIYSRLCHDYGLFILTDDGRLFLSLYVYMYLEEQI